MKCIYGEVGVGQIFSRLPRVIVAQPIHLVVEFASPKLGIEDRINLELRQIVHLDGHRGRHDAIGERVRHMRLQADMEDRMNVRRRRQLLAIG